MTKQEFINGYCERGGLAWELLSSRRVAVPCDCSESMCNGWKMIPKDDEQCIATYKRDTVVQSVRDLATIDDISFNKLQNVT